MKKFACLFVAVLAVIVGYSTALAHTAMPNQPCSYGGGCQSSSDWSGDINGAETEVVAYQGNLPTDSWMDEGLEVLTFGGGSNEELYVGLTVSNNENSPDCGENTHGHVYWFAYFIDYNGAKHNGGCGDIGGTNYGQEIFLWINKYASNGGGTQAYVCEIECRNASGSEIIKKYSCGGCNISWPNNDQYVFSGFGDDGSSYNNNTYPKDAFIDSQYQDTSGTWHTRSGNPEIFNQAENPVQWYNGTSISGGDAIFCDEADVYCS